MNYIKQINKLSLIIIFIFLFLITIFIFREDILAEYKDMFNIKPLQYYGATVDMSQILPESKHYIVNNKGEDLIDIANKLGINTLRITNITSPTDQRITSSYTQKQWKEVLGKMRRKGIYAVILIEPNSTDTEYFKTEINDSYTGFVKQYVVDANLCKFSNIVAIDIRNEPLLNHQNLAKLKAASRILKSSCPAMKVTIGSWKTDSGEKDSSGQPIYNWHDPKGAALLTDIIDFYSVHIYGFDKLKDGNYPDPYKLTITYLNEIRRYTNKPILIEEFGAGNGSTLTDQDTLGSEILQKAAYEGVLKATNDLKDKNILGALAYLLYPRSNAPEGWNIAKNNGNVLLPAAYTFKKYSRN